MLGFCAHQRPRQFDDHLNEVVIGNAADNVVEQVRR